jgi:hypothetical protein
VTDQTNLETGDPRTSGGEPTRRGEREPVSYVVIVTTNPPGGSNVWLVAGELTVPANTKLSTAERMVLEQGPDVPSLGLRPESGVAWVRLVRADGMSDPVAVRARETVVIDVLSDAVAEMAVALQPDNGEASYDDPPAVER